MFNETDIVILNARIIDGTGQPSRIASIQVRPPIIQKIFSQSELNPREKLELGTVHRVIDCENGRWAVTPGFIDMHAHSDLSLLHTPSHLAKITQGVTTEVLGQDGIGYAPVDDTCLANIRTQIAGWNGNPEDPTFWSWRSVKQYLDTLDDHKIATNAAFLVPQGNLRMLVLGYNPRSATEDEIREMQKILITAMEQGAVGMSSGLTYVPGMYAPDSELAQLLPIVRQYGGYYCPHHRSYGKGALKAYQEMIDLAKLTDIPLHLTHAILNFDENKGKASEFLAMLDRGRADGVRISLDTYPYLPGSTTLAAQLPSWTAADGPDSLLLKLQDEKVLEKIRYGVEVIGTDGCHGCTIEWDTIELVGVSNESLNPVIGHTIAQLVEAVRSDPTSAAAMALGSPLPAATGFDVMIRVLVLDKLSTAILQHVGHEENVRAIMQDSHHCGGSDGILTSAKPHPRGYGTFTRYLGHYGRELTKGKERDIYRSGESDLYKDVIPTTVFPGGIEEVVAHLTSRPASILRLKNRGKVAENFQADLVILDPETVRDSSTYSHPSRASQGVRFVLVNGEIAIDETRPTHARAGKTIRLLQSNGVWGVQ